MRNTCRARYSNIVEDKMKYSRRAAIKLHDDLVEISRKIVIEYNNHILGVVLNNGGNWNDAKYAEFKCFMDEMNKDVLDTMKEINTYANHLSAKIKEYE